MTDASPREAAPARTRAAGGEDLAGTSAGAWRLQRLLARGGMGDVYHAVAEPDRGRGSEEDGGGDRGDGDGRDAAPVVVKVLRRELGSPELVRRLQREHTMLAALRHPGIVELRDAGTLEDGRPFLVTSFVDGLHLDEHCHGLEPRRTLAVMADLADVVQAVHARGSVHRDLKPTNVIVTPAGRPVVLDFGVATQLAPAAAHTTITSGGAPLTPYFASPEVLAGLPPSSRSDVFSLGIVLRDLLGASSPAPPACRRACDRIVERATSIDPRDRHADAGALARDLRRVLAGRRIGAGHRVRRAVRRHRAAVLAAAVAAGGLAVAAAVATGESARSRRANAEALSVSEFLVHLLDRADPAANGAAVTLPDAWRQVEPLMPQVFAGKPSAEARVRMAFGRACSQHGRWREAAAHFERAIELLLATPDHMPESVAWCRAQLAACSAHR